tara:strand:- start:198 stop:797 length:600 start_codon:yes stop_codon:yes gene_type:complete
MGEESLDEFLAGVPGSVFSNSRKLLRILREAYTYGVPAMMVKSMTDRLGAASGDSFHLGTPDPSMRRIASWIFTNVDDVDTITELVTKLWKRHGREDAKLAGLLMANLPIAPWNLFLSVLNEKEAIEGLLEVIEEIGRGGHDVPSLSSLQTWIDKGGIYHQTVLLILHGKGSGIPDEVVQSAPPGGDIFERIRSRLLLE